MVIDALQAYGEMILKVASSSMDIAQHSTAQHSIASLSHLSEHLCLACQRKAKGKGVSVPCKQVRW